MKNKLQKLLSLLLAVTLLICGGVLGASAVGDQREVYVGGMPFGVKFFTEGVLIVGFCDVDTETAQVNPAQEAGLKIKDVITAINGTPITGASDLTQAVENSGGAPLEMTVKRMAPSKNGKNDHRETVELTVTVTPRISVSEKRYKTGIWVRDSGAGIGTVTFVIPSTNAFAGLGHGICDGETGELIPMQRGQVSDVTVSGIDRGEAGDPGAIKGYFAPGKTGTLVGNTDCGVFGIFAACPSTATNKCLIATKERIKEGDATIRCTLDDGHIGEYAVHISGINTHATGSKCFTVTVTDPALIEKTGGIVQGMSGSPILQDGKLIGAVTHVLVNDPVTGYGIFIENMLRDMPELLK